MKGWTMFIQNFTYIPIIFEFLVELAVKGDEENERKF